MVNSKTNKRSATLKDVAALAGVSYISVSRVMRDAPNISDKLREKVLTAANELGYTPNRVAGALKTSSSNLVAVVVPSMSNAVFPEVIDGIDSILSQAGLQPVLGITHYDTDRETQVVRDLLSWAPMGVIVAGIDHSPAVSRMLTQKDIPVVEVMDVDGEPLQAAVGISHIGAAEAVADLVASRGYKRIGYIGAWGERPKRSRSRRLAFEARLKHHGLELEACLIKDENSSVSLGRSAMAAFLEENAGVECVFFANDDLAVGATLHCMARNMRIPEEIALIGFNGIDAGRALPIQLTTVDVARYKMGEEAARTLIALSEDKEVRSRTDLGFKVFNGGSC